MNSFYADNEFGDGAWLYQEKKQQAQSSWRNHSLLNKPWQQPPTVKIVVIRMCIKTLTLSSCKMDQTTTLSAVCIQRLICPVLHLKGDNYMGMGTGRAVFRTTMSQYICIKPCKAFGRCLRVSLNPTVSWKLTADDGRLLVYNSLLHLTSGKRADCSLWSPDFTRPGTKPWIRFLKRPGFLFSATWKFSLLSRCRDSRSERKSIMCCFQAAWHEISLQKTRRTLRPKRSSDCTMKHFCRASGFSLRLW